MTDRELIILYKDTYGKDPTLLDIWLFRQDILFKEHRDSFERAQFEQKQGHNQSLEK